MSGERLSSRPTSHEKILNFLDLSHNLNRISKLFFAHHFLKKFAITVTKLSKFFLTVVFLNIAPTFNAFSVNDSLAPASHKCLGHFFYGPSERPHWLHSGIF